MYRKKLLFLLLLNFLVTFSTGCSPEVNRPPNIILIVLDTVRKDHLSCYGSKRETTPNIDRLAGQGVLFTNAVSTASWTLPSHASMFTGLYPSTHKATFAKAHIEDVTALTKVNFLDEKFTTLAEVLKDHGYATGGFVAAAWCRAVFGLGQGFDVYSDDYRSPGGRTAREINDDAFEWLKNQKKGPFFLFINYFDAHSPFDPPESFKTLYQDDPKSMDGYIQENKTISYVIKNKIKLTDALKERILALYDGEINYVDSEIGRLAAFLKSLKVYDNSIIIITSDHGESFGEHYLMDHGRALYEELIHVPLIIIGPNFSKGVRREFLVQNVDFMPTILDLLKIEIPLSCQGKSFLKPMMSQDTSPTRMSAFSEASAEQNWIKDYGERFNRNQKSIRTKEWKLIRSSNGEIELYQISTDPEELWNLVEDKPEEASRLMENLFQWERTVYSDKPESQKDIGEETQEQLRSLGYIQ